MSGSSTASATDAATVAVTVFATVKEIKRVISQCGNTHINLLYKFELILNKSVNLIILKECLIVKYQSPIQMGDTIGTFKNSLPIFTAI